MASLGSPSPKSATKSNNNTTPSFASPDLSMGHNTTLVDSSSAKAGNHPRVHFHTDTSDIQADFIEAVSTERKNRPPTILHESPVTPETVTTRQRGHPSPAAQSCFQSPSYNYTHQPYLFTRNRTPPSSSPTAKAVGMGRSKAPSNRPTDISYVSTLVRIKQNDPRLPPCQATAATATAAAAARVARERESNQDPLRRENDHALQRSKRSFIISTKSPIDAVCSAE